LLASTSTQAGCLDQADISQRLAHLPEIVFLFYFFFFRAQTSLLFIITLAIIYLVSVIIYFKADPSLKREIAALIYLMQMLAALLARSHYRVTQSCELGSA
jgi:hypothetical protein